MTRGAVGVVETVGAMGTTRDRVGVGWGESRPISGVAKGEGRAGRTRAMETRRVGV